MIVSNTTLLLLAINGDETASEMLDHSDKESGRVYFDSDLDLFFFQGGVARPWELQQVSDVSLRATRRDD